MFSISEVAVLVEREESIVGAPEEVKPPHTTFFDSRQLVAVPTGRTDSSHQPPAPFATQVAVARLPGRYLRRGLRDPGHFAVRVVEDAVIAQVDFVSQSWVLLQGCPGGRSGRSSRCPSSFARSSCSPYVLDTYHFVELGVPPLLNRSTCSLPRRASSPSQETGVFGSPGTIPASRSRCSTIASTKA